MNLKNKLISLIKKQKYNTFIDRLDTNNDNSYERNIKKIINLLNYTKSNNVSYSAGVFNSGYHSFKIDNYNFEGQRKPEKRLKNIPFSFKGLSVLDIGCNQGGMLYHLSKDLKFGVGIDYDYKMINIAKKLKSYNKIDNLDYFIFNLETENLNYIYDFIPEDKVDVVFLLSICMWIKNWKEVINFSFKISKKMIFESNGSIKQQQEQFTYLKSIYKNIQLIEKFSNDDVSQKNRKLYYCF